MSFEAKPGNRFEDIPSAHTNTALPEAGSDTDAPEVIMSTDSLEVYHAELLEQVKASLSNRSFFKENHLTKGLQTLGVLRVMYQHWYRTLQQLKTNPHDKKLAAVLNKHYNKIQDLIEVINNEIASVSDEPAMKAEVPVAETVTPVPEVPLSLTDEMRVKDEPLILTNDLRVSEPAEAALQPVKLDEAKTPEMMSSNVLSIADKYKAERAALRSNVDELLNNSKLPTEVLNSLSLAKSQMLTSLESLPYTDSRYLGLRERIKEVINAAEQLAGVETTVAPATKIEGANQFLSPRWTETKTKLSRNSTLKVALLAAMGIFLVPEKASQYSEDVQLTTADMSSPLSRMGIHAQWVGDKAATILAEAPQNDPEKIVVVRPFTGESVETPVTSNESSETDSTEALPTTPIVAEEVASAQADTHEDTLPKVSEVVVNRFGYEPSTIETPSFAETLSASESIEVKSGGENVIEVRRGDETTYPDRAIDTVFATVDTSGLPEVLVTRLKAEEKTAFLSNRDRLKAAGLESGQKNVTFPGEKINYTDPKQSLESRIAEYWQYLSVPHTEVSEADDNLTQLTLKSYARDLAVLDEADRLSAVEVAIENYLKTPGALEQLQLEDKDTVPTGVVVPLQALAPFLATAVAEKVRSAAESGSASEVITEENVATDNVDLPDTVAVDTAAESGSASEILTDENEVSSPEEYPGGVLAYSQAYNERLESLGIATKAPSMLDSWFSVRTPDNRELLTMTVGELTKIMMQSPVEVARELESRKIALESANAVYQLVIDARANGEAPYDIDSAITLDQVIAGRVLAEAVSNSI